MRPSYILLAFIAVALLSGCATNKALVHVSAEQRAHLRFDACTNCPVDMRFKSIGAKSARRYGAYGGALGVLVGFSVASGIEQDNAVLRHIRQTAGTFETQVMNDAFAAALARNAATNRAFGEATVQVRLHTVGLQELERKRFSAFAVADAELRNAQRKVTWKATAESASPNHASSQTSKAIPRFTAGTWNR